MQPIIVAYLGRLNPIGIVLSGFINGTDLSWVVKWHKCSCNFLLLITRYLPRLIAIFPLASDALIENRYRFARKKPKS